MHFSRQLVYYDMHDIKLPLHTILLENLTQRLIEKQTGSPSKGIMCHITLNTSQVYKRRLTQANISTALPGTFSWFMRFITLIPAESRFNLSEGWDFQIIFKGGSRRRVRKCPLSRDVDGVPQPGRHKKMITSHVSISVQRLLVNPLPAQFTLFGFLRRFLRASPDSRGR